MYKIAYIKTYFDNMVLPYFINDGMKIEDGEWYVVSTKFGDDVGKAMSNVLDKKAADFGFKNKHSEINNDTDIDDIEIDDESILEDKKEHMPVQLENNKVLRKATIEQIKERERFAQEEINAYEMAKKEIESFELEMKLVNVHFLMGKKKVIFNFTADNRIDFRQLVKRLASIFKTRIEMRQIGVRDAAKIQGGYGVCGEQCCCLRSNCHMNSIYLKMAKDQGFVVNSSKLTGLCGRLMCCLAYENDFYLKERQKFPNIGSIVNDGHRDYRIFSVNILKDEIYSSDEHHHQKKFNSKSIKFIKKDNQGVAYYRSITQ